MTQQTDLMFSSRTDWHRKPNRLAEMRDRLVTGGRTLHDLTASNPTMCGIMYPTREIIAAVSQPESIVYHPDPRGMLAAREAVAAYYSEKNINIEPSDLILTASTSEAYSMLFSLVCEPGETVLIPLPSYPLFELLAQLSDVECRPYRLQYDGTWFIDLDSVRRAITDRTRAILLVSPHNPTGACLKKTELTELLELAAECSLSLIVDEVFSEYTFGTDVQRVYLAAGASDILTFTLNGLSKLAGLPQMKLGWITVRGTPREKREALERLELIADTFLSVNTPVQIGLPTLLKCTQGVRRQIQQRIAETRSVLEKHVDGSSPYSLLNSEGGWSAILRLPGTRTDEEWALQILEHTGVYTYPGYFFDFEDDGYLVLSLLPETTMFSHAVRGMMEFIRSQ